MKPWLFVGARVTPVKFMSREAYPDAISLTRGAVYTVRDIVTNARWQGQTAVGLRLEEVKNTLMADGRECAFLAENFRPVSTINTTKQVEALKKIARDAFMSGRVDA